MFYQLHHIATGEYIKKEYGENFSYPPHMHQCFELAVVLEGKMTIGVDKNACELSKGDAVLIFPNRIHSLSSTSSKHVLFIFSPKIVQSFTVKYAGMLPTTPKFTLPEYLIRALDALDPNESMIAAKGVLYSASAELERQVDFHKSYNDEGNLLMRIFGFVDQNLRSDCSLVDVARALGYDHSYISRFFKKATGTSYNSYVNSCRLSHAEYLLKNSDLSILECAEESGYKSLRSFNRNFKEYFNMTPNEYRGS